MARSSNACVVACLAIALTAQASVAHAKTFRWSYAGDVISSDPRSHQYAYLQQEMGGSQRCRGAGRAHRGKSETELSRYPHPRHRSLYAQELRAGLAYRARAQPALVGPAAPQSH